MIGLKFLRHRNSFLPRVRRRYFSAEPSDSRKYVCVRRLTPVTFEFKIKEVLNHFFGAFTVCGRQSQLGLTDQQGKDFFRVKIKLIRSFEFKLNAGKLREHTVLLSI